MSKQEIYELVKNMLNNNIDSDKICMSTGLSMEQLGEYYEQYKSELVNKKVQEMTKDGGVVRSTVYDSAGRSKK